MAEILPELSATTTLTDRELLIHAIQHLEDLAGRLADLEDIQARVVRLDTELQVFLPLLRKLAPGGKADVISVMQARREARRGRT